MQLLSLTHSQPPNPAQPSSYQQQTANIIHLHAYALSNLSYSPVKDFGWHYGMQM
jgi:hypothetical protein